MYRIILICVLTVFFSLSLLAEDCNPMQLWYRHPAAEWTDALPIGNGRLGAMVFGGVNNDRIQLNEDTMWSGHPIVRANPGAKKALDKARQLLFDGQYYEAEKVIADEFMGKRISPRAGFGSCCGDGELRVQ